MEKGIAGIPAGIPGADKKNPEIIHHKGEGMAAIFFSFFFFNFYLLLFYFSLLTYMEFFPLL